VAVKEEQNVGTSLIHIACLLTDIFLVAKNEIYEPWSVTQLFIDFIYQ